MLFGRWFADAVDAELPEPNAMVLATAAADGTPHARTVLLKGHGPDGFRFFTNHTSQKGRDLAENPKASLVFPWHVLHRQVTIGGVAERLPEVVAAAYFQSRPYGSQIGAWASRNQSGVIDSRQEVEERFAELMERWPDPAAHPGSPPVPLPEFWGGYLVAPTSIEFWQGRPDRLHDRFRYRRAEPGGEWIIERLSP